MVNVDSFDFICPGFEISISEFLLPPKYRGGEWIFVCGVHLTEELQLNKIYRNLSLNCFLPKKKLPIKSVLVR